MQSGALSKSRSVIVILSVSTLLGFALLHSEASRPRHAAMHSSKPTHAVISAMAESIERMASYGRLPLAFESNQGQTNKQVQFLSHGLGYSLFLTPTEAVLSLQSNRPNRIATSKRTLPSGFHARVSSIKGEADGGRISTASVLRLKLAGSNPHPLVTGQDALPGSVNYFIGKDRSKWRTGIASYGKVSYKNVYPGIDLVYYGNQQQLEYDWVVSPGADVHRIALDISGAQRASISASGDLLLHATAGDLIQHAPVVYQEIDGQRKQISAHMALQSSPEGSSKIHDQRIGFKVGSYDRSRPLIIDPVLVYSTYVGGSGFDSASGIAVDSYGNAYITGQTSSPDFPLVAPIQPTNHANTTNGFTNIFVSEVNAAGTALVYSTYLGGSQDEEANGIALDSLGDAYVAGLTESADFPTLNALYSNLPSTTGAGFVTKLNAAGNALLYSTYLGGTNGAEATGIAVDKSGNAYVAGGTGSTDFPTKNAIQSVNNGHGILGDGNAFITEINAAGSALVYSTYYGGSHGDTALAIAVDTSGNTYVTGDANSTDFPVHNAFQVSAQGEGDAFVLKIDANGAAVVYASYLGGSLIDHAHAIAVDSGGNAYVGGDTNSVNFPNKGAFQTSNHNTGGVSTGFVSKISSTGGLVWSTYLGGSGGDSVGNGESVDGVTVDGSGEAYVTGSSSSLNFPTVNAVQSTNGGGNAFVTKFNAAGSALLFSTFLGGTGGDFGAAIAIDSFGNAFVTGETRSSNFPTISPLQSTIHSQLAANAYIARININNGWQVADVSASSDGKARLLWYNQQGAMKLWSMQVGGAFTLGAVFGPYAGYTVRGVANGSDGFTRVLWNSTDGTAALWVMNSDNTFNQQHSYGPFSGWTAVDVTVGGDNITRILWANTNGSIVVWSVDDQGNQTQGPIYGPYAGWTPRAIAGGPATDGFTRVIWNNNGQVALWLMNANNTKNSQFSFGPISGWSAIDVSAGIDNTTRLLWVNAIGQGAYLVGDRFRRGYEGSRFRTVYFLERHAVIVRIGRLHPSPLVQQLGTARSVGD